MPITTRASIDEFLAQRRLALVGVSRDPKDFSRSLFGELRRRGYDMVPVNPLATEIEDQRCFASLQDVIPPVEGALVMTPAEKSEKVVQDCAAAGIHHVWLYRAGGAGAVSEAAVDFCQQRGLHLVAGYCPYMFLPDTPWFHRAHAFIMKLGGSYPACGSQPPASP